VRANIDRRFLWRLGLTASAFLGIALWFLYDGAITYPRQRERALAYQGLKLKYQGLKEEDRLSEWQKIARQRGWPTEDPGKPKGVGDIYFQLVIAALVGLPGLLFSFCFIRARGRWIEVNETGLRTSWGRQLEFGQIVSLGKKKWKSKGIARINYRQNGRKQRLLLDDWKYDAEPTRAILREVESRLDVSQIVGGAPEPLPQDEHHEDDPAAGHEAT
jgi:hypothetical protein